MQETMPLGRTYKYNCKNRLPKGYCCWQETMPLGRNYTHSSANRLEKDR